MFLRLAAFCVFGVAMAVAAQQPPPPPPPAGGGTAQGGRAGGAGGPVGGAPMALMEAPLVLGHGAISGVVTDGSTGAPIAGALVALTGTTNVVGQVAASRPSQVTDSKGRFIFTDLPASSFSLGASRPGYLTGGYRRLPGVSSFTPLTLTDGQWFTEGHIKLWRPAAISGAVRDERGEPLVSALVRLMVAATLDGRERWAVGPVVLTDDRGMYRFSGLMRGKYLVHVPSIQITLPSGEAALYRPANRGAAPAAAPDVLPVLRNTDGSGVVTGISGLPPLDDQGTVYASLFHPAARSLSDAEPIALEFAEDRAGIDLTMTPVPSVSVSGTVVGAPGLAAGIPVRILPAGNAFLGLAGDTGVTKTDASGAFTLHRIPAGDYLIVASRSVAEYQTSGGLTREALLPITGNPFWMRYSNMPASNGMVLNSASVPGTDVTGRLEVSVGNRNVTGLVVPVTPAVGVSGHVEWDGPNPSPGGPVALVRLEPADGDITLGPYAAVAARLMEESTSARAFTIENVKPGRYILAEMLGNQPPRLIGATWNGRDLLDTPLEVSGDRPVTGIVLHMTMQNNKIAGTVRDADNQQRAQSAPSSFVVAFPASPSALGPNTLSRMRFRTATVTAAGTYELTGLLPGDYLLAAVPLEDRAQASEPAFLASLVGRATRVTMGLASTVSQDLRVIEGKR